MQQVWGYAHVAGECPHALPVRGLCDVGMHEVDVFPVVSWGDFDGVFQSIVFDQSPGDPIVLLLFVSMWMPFLLEGYTW